MKARIDKFKVQRLMRDKGLDTLQDLAKAAALGENTIYRSLDKYTWKSATLHSIAAALECNPKDILTVDAGDTADTRSNASAGLIPAMA